MRVKCLAQLNAVPRLWLEPTQSGFQRAIHWATATPAMRLNFYLSLLHRSHFLTEHNLIQISCSFVDYLDLCLANKGLELGEIPGTENIPDNIKMTHLKTVWNSAVQLSDDFHKERLAASA